MIDYLGCCGSTVRNSRTIQHFIIADVLGNSTPRNDFYILVTFRENAALSAVHGWSRRDGRIPNSDIDTSSSRLVGYSGCGSFFSQSLTGFFQAPGQSNVVPQARGCIATEKSCGWIGMVQDQIHNLSRQEHFLLFRSGAILLFVCTNQVAKVNVARVPIAIVPSATQHIIVVRHRANGGSGRSSGSRMDW